MSNENAPRGVSKWTHNALLTATGSFASISGSWSLLPNLHLLSNAVRFPDLMNILGVTIPGAAALVSACIGLIAGGASVGAVAEASTKEKVLYYGTKLLEPIAWSFVLAGQLASGFGFVASAVSALSTFWRLRNRK